MSYDDDSDGGGITVAGVALLAISVLSLWYNEGRFNYAQAARESVELSSLADGASHESVSYTGSLGECWIRGDHQVEDFSGFYQVTARNEIYSWEKRTDEDGDVSWSKDWHPKKEQNSRNDGFTQELQGGEILAEKFVVGGMEVLSKDLHFADRAVLIDPASLTLIERGGNLGLQMEGEYLYLRRSGGLADGLGDERVRYEGIPVADTATYFGALLDKQGHGRKFDLETGGLDGFINDLIDNDGILHHLVNGERREALSTMRAHHRKLKWSVRGLGTIGVIVGIFLSLAGALHLLIAIPILGDLVSFGAVVGSIAMGVVISFLTITASLLVHHPLMAVLILGLLCLALVWFVRRGRKSKSNARMNLEYMYRSSEPQGQGGADHVVEPPGEQGGEPGGGDALVHRSFRNMVRLVFADGEFDAKENKFLVTWGGRMGLDPETMQELVNTAHADIEKSEMTGEEDLELLISLALSDGHLSTREMNYILTFGQKLGLDRSQVRAEIGRIQAGQPRPLVAAAV